VTHAAVLLARRGRVVIVAKTMRMKGPAQHDAAEYVPAAMFEYWKTQDPIARYEAYLTEHKLWDAAKKSEIDARIERELDVDQKFAEESPMPPPELAEQGVYCDGCHTIEADWRRPKQELLPPASCVEAVWRVTDFGAFVPPAPAAKPAVAAAAGRVEKLGAKPAPAPVAALPATPEPAEEQPLRVPFGRGPKDRAFERERLEKQEKRGKAFVKHRRDKRGKH